jgi:type I restriction enzyme M protein
VPGTQTHKSLTDIDALPAPDILAAEIADDLEAALEQFTKIAERLEQTQEKSSTPSTFETDYR